jgi:hypothetical protein
VIVKPMIGSWEVPRIERIAVVEGRRIARLPVPGLVGDLQQDLGTDSLSVEIFGSLQGDEARDQFLDDVHSAFLAGDPVSFVADIVTATELDQVLVEALELEEVNEPAGCFHYRIRLRQYVEPPEPPTPIDELGADLGVDLGALADLGLAGLDLPGILADIPSVGDPTPPLRTALQGVQAAVAPLGDMLSGLKTTLGA